MKKLILIALLFTGLSTYAQVERSPLVGYFFGGKSNFYEGSLKINDNINYGMHLGFDAGGHTMLELSYAMTTHLQLY